MGMKKVTIILGVLAAIGVANATNLLVNGDFEQTPGGTGWTQWWGGNSSKYAADPLNAANHCGGVWWYDDGISQVVTIGPGMYEFGGKLMTNQGMVDRRGVIQAELGGQLQQLNIVPGDAINVWHIAKPQAGFPNSAIVDNTTFGATTFTINLMMANIVGNGSGIVFYDDVYFGPLGVAREAKFPHPYISEVVPPATDVLKWTNPDPNNPADTITSVVYLEVDDGDPNFHTSAIANGITTKSVTLSALTPPVSLLPGTKYGWRVDCTDPHGSPATKQGAYWTFTTRNDNPPVVAAGPDQYNWLDMADGDGDPTKVTFTLNGQLTDDGASPVTKLWSLIYSEQAPATVVSITNPASLVTTVTINGTGLFRFLLVADDAFAHAEDTVDVYVYGNACEAAQGDPADHYQTYVFVGDVNNDCKVNLDDLSIMAATWLDCLSSKLGCTP